MKSILHKRHSLRPASPTFLKAILLTLLAYLAGAGILNAQTATVADLQATGTNIKWYLTPTGGSPLSTSTLLVNGQHYYASQTVGGVESLNRLEVVANLAPQVAPTAGTHVASQTQVVWNWNSASGATGYKWNTVNTYGSATDMGTGLTKTETGLTCGTSYTRYVWAYNASGCSSTVLTLTQSTSSCASPPAVATSAASSVGSSWATLNGNITATNGANPTVRGFKYSTTNGFDPASAGTNVSESGSFGTGTYSQAVTGLSTTTTYYVRAYATNSAGTTYGDQVSFTTINFTTWTFTPAGATGRTGPTQAQVNSAYTGTSLQGSVTINTQGIQEWTVPVAGNYTIQAKGAQGARSGGLGADMTGTFALTQGEVIKIAVGQTGQNGSDNTFLGGGGGGGSFVIRTPYNNAGSILVIAGGGGGYTNSGVTTTMNAYSTSSGGSTYSSGGGTSGNGGGSGQTNGGAAGGGGFFTSGTSGNEGDVYSGGGGAFVSGAVGGNEGHIGSYLGGDGGFGGGGGGWNNTYNRSGGGGGYSGGQGGTWSGQESGGGGGSINNGINPTNTVSNSGNGSVVITYNPAATTFSYTGAQQTFTVPAGVTTVTIEAWGAQGWSGSYAGGKGGYATGTLAVTPGQTLYIYVGGQGSVAAPANTPSGAGWNGGGMGQTNSSPNSAGGGGGASDVRTGGTALANRVIVAAGGGGATNNGNCTGGDGGGLTGGNTGGAYGGGIGATQSGGGTFGGSLGQGGNALVTYTPWNGGGGGGYYGGGTSDAHGSGGGGSSYIGGVTGGSTTAGLRTGNGQVIIHY